MIRSYFILLITLLVVESSKCQNSLTSYTTCKKGLNPKFLTKFENFKIYLYGENLLDDNSFSYYNYFIKLNDDGDVWVSKDYDQFPAFSTININGLNSCFNEFLSKNRPLKIKWGTIVSNLSSDSSLDEIGNVFLSNLDVNDFDQIPLRDQTILMIYMTAIMDSTKLEIPEPNHNK